MIDTKALRSRILDLAIQGKLTQQLESDGTAEELYQQIQAKKQKLTKEKPLPPIKNEEIPFEIPSNWKWVLFGDIMRNRDSERIPVSVADRKKLKKVYDYYGASGVIDKVETFLFDKKLLLIGEDGANLLSRSTPIAFLAEGKYWVNNHAHVLDCYVENYLDFIMYYINSISLVPFVTGSAQPKLNQDRMNKIPVPLPPLAEQKRIVERVEEIFRLLDTIDEAQEKYSADAASLRSKLITAGIQGKLTQQLPSDGTAEELYQQIQAEKQKLISEGKLKKEKPLPPIKPEEIPFEIPQNWKWVRMNEISAKITDGTHHSPINTESGDFMYVTAKNIKDNGVDLSNITYVSQEVHDEIFSRCNPELNDVLLIKDGATTGVVTVNNISEPFSLLSSVALIKPVQTLVDPWYIAYVLRSELFYKTIRAQMTGTGITRIVLRQIEPFIVPLPPLAEQKRIAETLEKVLGALN